MPAFAKEGLRIDQERRDAVANRSMAGSTVIVAFVLGAIQPAEGRGQTSWQHAISLVIGAATVIAGIASFVRYRSGF